MTFNINRMRAALVGGGARPSQFEIMITNPISSIADINVPIMTKAAQIPGHTLGKIEVPYFGRKIPMPGDRVIQDWTTTIINDTSFDIRNSLEEWMNAMNSQQGNVATRGNDPANYISTAAIRHFGRDGNLIRTYEVNGIFPMEISPIELSWESVDTIEEYQVTWAVTDFEVTSTVTGNAGGV